MHLGDGVVGGGPGGGPGGAGVVGLGNVGGVGVVGGQLRGGREIHENEGFEDDEGIAESGM